MVFEKIFPTTKIETGMPFFDQITGGGLPRPAAIAFIGNADGGKEIWIRQLTWSLLNIGVKVLYYTVSQSAEELRNSMLSYNWDVKSYEGKGQFSIADVFSLALDKVGGQDFNPSELSYPHQAIYDLKFISDAGIKFFGRIPRRTQWKVCVFDSISPLFSTNAKGVFKMIHSLKFASRIANATGIGIMHSGIHDTKTEETFKSLADAVIEIKKLGSSRYIRLLKFPGEYQEGPFPIVIRNKEVKIIPMVMPDFV